MKRIYYLCSICFVTYSTLAHADISFSYDTLLIANIESTLAVESPFSSTNNTKLAAVYPIASSSGISFKTPKSVNCSAGYTNINGKCVKKCDRTIYPLTSAPSSTKGVYTSCTGAGIFYGYTSCNNGWTLEGHDCVSSKCTGYPYSERPGDALGTVESCKSGEITYYKYTSCNSGWNLDDGKCIAQGCSSLDYPYTSDPGSNAGTVVSCKSGATTLYGYSSCNLGWSKSGGYCNINTCDTNVYPYTSRAQATGCQSISECKSGTNSYFTCGAGGCEDGYSKNGFMCSPCTWNGYTLNSCPEHGTCNSDVCGNVTKYGLSNCYTNYYRDGDTCLECTWNGYTLTSCPNNGICSQDICGGTTKYELTGCSADYYQSGNSCLACTWNGYTQTSCPDNGVCSQDTCGGTTKYALTGCQAGYAQYHNSCIVPCTSPQVGYIYYADGSCSATVVSGKTPIGVVFDANMGLVVSLDFVGKCWNDCTTNYVDIPALGNNSNETAISDLEGKLNTNAIIDFAVSSGQEHQAAQYCHDMTLGDKEWYLPSLGELRLLADNYNTVQQVLSNIDGASSTLSGLHWSSTELVDGSRVFDTYLNNSDIFGHTKDAGLYVRCVFGMSICGANYYFNGNRCDVCTWSGYTLETCPEHGICAYDSCGGTVKYALTGCESGYTQSGDSCNCSVGTIYYSDNTCSQSLISGKTPIGVIIDADNRVGIALNYCSVSNWYGAQEVCASNPGTVSWHISSWGNLNAVYANRTLIDSALTLAGGAVINCGVYWTESSGCSSASSTRVVNPCGGSACAYMSAAYPNCRCTFNY